MSEIALKDVIARISAIDGEIDQHRLHIAEAEAEQAKLQSELDSVKAERQQKVNQILDDTFVSGEDKGLVSAVLKTKVSEPKVAEILGKIDSLAAAIAWHHSKASLLTKERRELTAQREQIVVDSLAVGIIKSMNRIVELVEDAQGVFEPMLQSVAELKRLRPSSLALDTLTRNGAPPWQPQIIGSQLERLDRADVLEWLTVLAVYPHPQNRLFRPHLRSRIVKHNPNNTFNLSRDFA